MTLWLWLKISHLPYKYVCKYKKRVGVRKSIRQLSVTSCLQPCGVGRAQLQSGICLIRLPDRTEQKGRAPDETGKERKQSQCIVGVFFFQSCWLFGSLHHHSVSVSSTPLPFLIVIHFCPSLHSFSLFLCVSPFFPPPLCLSLFLCLISGQEKSQWSPVLWCGVAVLCPVSSGALCCQRRAELSRQHAWPEFFLT